MRSHVKSFVLCLCVMVLGCQSQDEPNRLRIGTVAGPETQLMEVAKEVAQQQNLTIKIVEFEDYTLPNVALNDGAIQANLFQHKPYLDNYNKTRKTNLVVVGASFVYPMGVYSEKYESLEALPQGAKVAIPNDPSNGARALLLLEKAGLIKLRAHDDFNLTIQDVTENPKKLKFVELDAAQLPRVLKDVDIAVINTNYSLLAGLLPSRDALAVESADSPYANVVVVKAGHENDPRIQILLDALHSKAVRDKADELFQGQAIPAW